MSQEELLHALEKKLKDGIIDKDKYFEMKETIEKEQEYE